MAQIKVMVNSQLIGSINLDAEREYIIGRDPKSDLVIDDVMLSRKHLRLYYDGLWKIEILSKYDIISCKNLSTKELELEGDKDFQVQKYQFIFKLNITEAASDYELESPIEADVNQDLNEAKDFDENTNVEKDIVSPYLSYDGERHLLEGKEWFIGRSDKCNFVIQDSKASRKHCVVTRNDTKYFISDLGSSNGTYLNGIRMKPKKLAPLKSDDVIRIGQLEIRFELINRKLEEQIKEFPKQVAPVIPQPSMDSVIQNHLAQAKSGAVRINPPTSNKKQINIKFLGIAAAVILVLAILLSGGKKETKQRDLSSREEIQSEFDKLSQDNQNLVLRFYDNAYRFYIQGEYKKALNETQKIHRLLPEQGYLDLSVEKDSRKLEGLALAAVELNKRKEEIRAEQERLKQQKAEVAAMVENCDRQAVPGTSIEQVQRCLSTVYELDPDNAAAKNIIFRLEMQAEERQRQKELAASYRSSVNQGKALYNRALNLERQNRYLDAISAYQRHIASLFPDPERLKNQSSEKIKKLSLELRQKVETLVKQAEADYESKNYKDAINKLNTALQLDPSVEEAKTLLANVTRVLNKEMQTLYSDSVLEESMGNIETAKSLWKKILDTDVSSGDYHQKATSKIKKYGN